MNAVLRMVAVLWCSAIGGGFSIGAEPVPAADEAPVLTVAPEAPSVPAKPGPVGGLGTVSPHPLPGAPFDVGRGEESGRALTCPQGSFPEGEANCGFPNDNVNGGCNNQFQVFSQMDCGFTVCGTAAFNGVQRDTDWYEFTLFQKRSVTWTVTSDFRALVGFVAGTGGVPDCGLATGINPFAYTTPGQPQAFTMCLGPGTWWFFIAPDLGGPTVTCGTKYYASMSCVTPCPTGACCMSNGTCQSTQGQAACLATGGRYQGDGVACSAAACAAPANDLCTSAAALHCGEATIADLRNATLSNGEELPICSSGGVASVWYTLAGTGQPVTVTTCFSDGINPNVKDSIIGVYTGTCGGFVQISCSDDIDCGAQGRLSQVCFNASNGSTYYIQVLAYSNADRGLYQVNVNCPCTGVSTGACCFEQGVCTQTTRSLCEQAQGFYRGDTTVCDSVACPAVTAPLNDECFNATLVIAPSSTVGYTYFAGPEASDLPSCGLAAQAPGVWYKVVGDGHEYTASLCSGALDFDARLLVFCGDCSTGPLTCVGASENGGTACGFAPEIAWCTQSGQAYSILVTAAGNAVGNFTLTMSRAAATCSNPVFCGQNCVSACPAGAASDGEPTCDTNYVDSTNGGCGTTANAHGTIACGQTVCGTSGNFTVAGGGLGRDTEWYRFTLAQQSTVTWTVKAEFLVQINILNDDCADLISYNGAYGNACQDVTCSATLDPGTYNVFVAPQFFTGTPCGAKWHGTLTCVATPGNGACCLTTCTCMTTTEANCTNSGGIYFAGVGSTCGATNCNPCPWDLNVDHVINTLDLTKLLQAFGHSAGGDMNCDGLTNTIDLTLLLQHWGQSCPN